MGFLEHIFGVLPAVDGTLVASLAIVADLVMRLVPSQKPLSVIHAASEGCHVIGDGLTKIGSILDRIFGQNTGSSGSGS